MTCFCKMLLYCVSFIDALNIVLLKHLAKFAHLLAFLLDWFLVTFTFVFLAKSRCLVFTFRFWHFFVAFVARFPTFLGNLSFITVVFILFAVFCRTFVFAGCTIIAHITGLWTFHVYLHHVALLCILFAEFWHFVFAISFFWCGRWFCCCGCWFFFRIYTFTCGAKISPSIPMGFAAISLIIFAAFNIICIVTEAITLKFNVSTRCCSSSRLIF